MTLSSATECAIFGMFVKMSKKQIIDRKASIDLVENGHKFTVAFDNTCGHYFGIIFPTDKGPLCNESRVFFDHEIDTLKTTVNKLAATATEAVAEYLGRLADKEVA